MFFFLSFFLRSYVNITPIFYRFLYLSSCICYRRSYLYYLLGYFSNLYLFSITPYLFFFVYLLVHWCATEHLLFTHNHLPTNTLTHKHTYRSTSPLTRRNSCNRPRLRLRQNDVQSRGRPRKQTALLPNRVSWPAPPSRAYDFSVLIWPLRTWQQGLWWAASWWSLFLSTSAISA